ncbi:MAG TPA: EAL domain-containing protein, partial [bacterium]|nr:EAL domain-containing protein [bacterium]
AVQMATMARLRREALAVTSSSKIDPELRGVFEQALADLWIAYQPLVGRDGSLYGHEALMRLKHPKVPHPGAMLEIAEQLDDLPTLGRTIRTRAASPVANAPESGALFVNLHPYDLNDPDLVSPGSPLAQIAERVVLEITERKDLSNIQTLRQRIIQLREIGFRVAVDDLGAGYAGLTSFALLEPDIVKIDMSLVRDLDRSPVKQRLVRSITNLCRDMGIVVVGEGVETKAERDALLEFGVDLLQGYLLAKPGQPFPKINW